MKCIHCKKEQQVPKFKIGDYAVESGRYNSNGNTEYTKIFAIQKHKGRFIYNTTYTITGFNYANEDELREPTDKELELYFR